jgi:hypothetical protein
MRILGDSLEAYFESSSLILVFSFLVLAVMLFLLTTFTYVDMGAGFVRYLDVVKGTISGPQALITVIVALVSFFSLAFLQTAVTIIIKLRRSMDDVGFFKLLVHFPWFVTILTVAWAVLGVAMFLVGTVFTAVGLPPALIAFANLLLMAFFLFLPQALILHDLSLADALSESMSHTFKKPASVVLYYLLAVAFLSFMLVIDVGLGQLKIVWLPALVNSAFLFLFVIPYLEVLKAQLFISTRYRLTLAGLK